MPTDRDRGFEYLDHLRASGVTNMFGASPYLAEGLKISLTHAREILKEWMKARA